MKWLYLIAEVKLVVAGLHPFTNGVKEIIKGEKVKFISVTGRGGS
jgi:hypothetical protein